MRVDDIEIARKAAEAGLSEGALSVAFLDAGYSSDRKYRVKTSGHNEYLVRLSDISEEPKRAIEFRAVGELHSAGVRCPDAICFGVLDATCYGIYTYIEGECAHETLPSLSPEEQRTVGIDAGNQLRLMHGLVASLEPVDDFAIRGAKHRRHLAQIADLGLRFDGDQRAADFVTRNLDLLRDRPTTFRHGDFHPGNLIISDGKLAGVVDFNRCDWGDPIDDFYKTAYFGAPVSSDYARGLIFGYFGGTPSGEFWLLYNLYVAATLPADLIWTQDLFPHLLAKTFKRVHEITATHDFQDGSPPAWWHS